MPAEPSAPYPLTFRGDPLSFSVPRDPDAILNAITQEEFEKDEFLPYWAEVWPAAGGLLSFLEANPPPPETIVCELGAGLGIAIACIARQTACSVGLELSFPACRFGRENGIRVSRTPPAVVCGDWRTLPFKPASFDLVVGSDILYEERWLEPVKKAFGYLLKPGGSALIADPGRRHWPRFKEWCQNEGLSVEPLAVISCNRGKSSIEITRFTAATG